MRIYYAAQCRNFELRWAWVINSLIQQRRPSFEMLIDCAVLEGDQNPLRYPAGWYGWFKLAYYETDRETFARRGLTRNAQLRRAYRAKADYIFFADADHVYPERFFRGLFKCCARNMVRACATATKKLHSQIEPTQAAVEATAGQWDIPDVYQRAYRFGFMYKPERTIAGGAMQVCDLAEVRRLTGGRYVDPAKTLDKHLFEQYQLARSDMQFRRDMGGTCGLDLPLQIHLQHAHDKHEGRKTHLDLQR